MPSNNDGFIRLVLARPFVQHVERGGFDSRRTLAAFGLKADLMSDPAAAAHAEIVYGLGNALADLAGDVFLGCHVAETFDIERWPLFSGAGQQAQTVGEFFTRLLTQVPQESSSVRHDLTVNSDRATFSVDRLTHTRNPPIQIEGFGIAMYLRLLRMVMAGNWSAAVVSLKTPYPDSVPRSYMGVDIRPSSRTGLSLQFPTEWLHSRFDLAVSHTDDTAPKGGSDLSIITALRSAALPLLADRALDSEQLAAALGLGLNRFEAALRLQNTTPAQELKRLRIDQAKIALRDSDRSIAEIGRTLGYADQSHFARFFRSQTGIAPRDFRRQQRNSAGEG